MDRNVGRGTRPIFTGAADQVADRELQRELDASRMAGDDRDLPAELAEADPAEPGGPTPEELRDIAAAAELAVAEPELHAANPPLPDHLSPHQWVRRFRDSSGRELVCSLCGIVKGSAELAAARARAKITVKVEDANVGRASCRGCGELLGNYHRESCPELRA